MYGEKKIAFIYHIIHKTETGSGDDEADAAATTNWRWYKNDGKKISTIYFVCIAREQQQQHMKYFVWIEYQKAWICM